MLVAREFKLFIFKLSTLLFVFFPIVGCEGQTSPDNLPIISLYFQRADGTKSESIEAELTRSAATRQKGLMYRRELPANRGMIFVFPGADQQIQMWMKNTYIPLDMIFISSERKVVGILRNIPILNLKPRTVEAKAKYLLEINAGAAEKLGIERGDVVHFDSQIEDAVD